MPLEIVHSPEPTPAVLTKSIFLAGPSPRKEDDLNWRPAAVEALRIAGFDGTLFLPIPRDGKWPENYTEQVEWERRQMALADVIAIWCPRDLERLPGFTTNVEFGEWLRSGKLLYGRPDGAPSTRYLDVRYATINQKQKPPFNTPAATLEQLASQCVERLGTGAERRLGERLVPLAIWRTPQFQAWYGELLAAGNRLDDVDVLWSFHIPQANNLLLCYALHVKVWVTAEKRHKENEFIVSRPDISAICAFYSDPKTHALLDTKVVLVREFRSTGRTADGFVHDLPGGSSFKPKENPLQLAASELKEETGVELAPERFRKLGARQLAATFGTHKAHLFAVRLTAVEIDRMEQLAKSGESFGVAADTEMTYIEVQTVGEILKRELVDHACVGMIMQACLAEWM